MFTWKFTLKPLSELKRIGEDKEWVAGVCAGLAYWLGIPSWTIRLSWFITIFWYGFGFVLYILLGMFLPKWEELPQDYDRLN